jgi:hypothetical protein
VSINKSLIRTILGPLSLGAFWVQISEKSGQNAAKDSKMMRMLNSFLHIEISAIRDFPILSVGVMFSFKHLRVYFCWKT